MHQRPLSINRLIPRNPSFSGIAEKRMGYDTTSIPFGAGDGSYGQLASIDISLMGRLVPDVLQWGITEAEFSWVLESNDLSYKTLKKGGAKITKQYRIYDFGPLNTTVNAKFMRQDSE